MGQEKLIKFEGCSAERLLPFDLPKDQCQGDAWLLSVSSWFLLFPIGSP